MAMMNTLSAPPGVARPARPGGDPLCARLADLYRRQLEIDPHSQYMIDHARPTRIWDQVQAFRWYAPHLPAGGAVLDWGCRHAPDSCLLRAAYGDRFELHGCDFADPGQFKPFHDSAGFLYRRLTDIVTVPYPSECFDVVIASGVLEHVAMEYESLKELYRIVKPDGLLVITYLPNFWSIQEWKLRVLYRRNYHQRYYGLGEACRLLKRCGFCPIATGHQTFLWERLLGLDRTSRASAALRALAPIHWFCSTLCMVAIKVVSF